jgi:hypothetical protein
MKTVSVRFDFFDDGPPIATVESMSAPNTLTLDGASEGYAESASLLTGAIVGDLEMQKKESQDGTNHD